MVIAENNQDLVRLLLKIAEKYQDPLMMMYLAEITLNTIKIERTAMLARQGDYEEKTEGDLFREK